MQAKTESKIDRSSGRPPSLDSEIERLRKQLQEKDMELEEVNANLKQLAADGPTAKVCSWLTLCMSVKASISKHLASSTQMCLQHTNLDEDTDMPTVDESVETFAKLKRVQPKQQELQRRLEAEGTLDEDDAEALDYLNDEVQSLLEILQQHGFNIPGYACTPSQIDSLPWRDSAHCSLHYWISATLLRILRKTQASSLMFLVLLVVATVAVNNSRSHNNEHASTACARICACTFQTRIHSGCCLPLSCDLNHWFTYLLQREILNTG